MLPVATVIHHALAGEVAARPAGGDAEEVGVLQNVCVVAHADGEALERHVRARPSGRDTRALKWKIFLEIILPVASLGGGNG